MKRQMRLAALATLVVGAGIVFQVGGCVSTLLNVGLGVTDFCALLGNNCALGPIAPCGDPNTPLDDIFVDCPLPAGTGV